MPKPTFTRLSPEKRQAFEAASLHEFSHYSFEQASISNIVRTLGIAKGSVYQYFDNKLDLYEYLVDVSSAKLHNVQSFVDGRAADNLKLWFVQRTMAEIKFAQQFKPEHALLDVTRNACSREIAHLSKKLYYHEMSSLEQLLEKFDIHSEALVQIIYAVKEQCLKRNIKSHQETSMNLNLETLYQYADIIFE